MYSMMTKVKKVKNKNTIEVELKGGHVVNAKTDSKKPVKQGDFVSIIPIDGEYETVGESFSESKKESWMW